MGKTLGIIGSGHLGQQIAHYAVSDNHYENIVFFDDFTDSKFSNGYPVAGKTDFIEEAYRNNVFDELIVAIGYKHMDSRKAFFERFFGRIPFGNVVHSSCWVDSTAVLGTGIVVYPSCAIDAHVVLGNNLLMNIGCTIAHDTKVSDHCFLSPRVALAGFITVGEQSIIGINATVIDNIKIEPKTQLGGGSVVIKNIEESGLYVGNPIRFIR